MGVLLYFCNDTSGSSSIFCVKTYCFPVAMQEAAIR